MVRFKWWIDSTGEEEVTSNFLETLSNRDDILTNKAQRQGAEARRRGKAQRQGTEAQGKAWLL